MLYNMNYATTMAVSPTIRRCYQHRETSNTHIHTHTLSDEEKLEKISLCNDKHIQLLFDLPCVCGQICLLKLHLQQHNLKNKSRLLKHQTKL